MAASELVGPMPGLGKATTSLAKALVAIARAAAGIGAHASHAADAVEAAADCLIKLISTSKGRKAKQNQ